MNGGNAYEEAKRAAKKNKNFALERHRHVWNTNFGINQSRLFHVETEGQDRRPIF